MRKPITHLKTPENRSLSPYTGWTREHWLELAEILLSSVPKFADKHGGLVHYPGVLSCFGRHSDGMEAFSRSMILASIYLAGGGKPVIKAGGKKFDIARFFRQGLVAGTDPDHRNYWGDMQDPHVVGLDLRPMTVLECGSMAWCIYVGREFLWDPLSDPQKKQIMGWITMTNQRPTWLVNWIYFRIFANTVAKKLGHPYSQERLDEDLKMVDGFYHGGGWYKDGASLAFDMYNPWALHLYPTIWKLIDGESKPELAERFASRTREFLQRYKYFFGANGAYPAYGRSLIYRFGAVSLFGMAERMKISPVPPGQARRISSGCIQYFLKNGMLTGDNYLSLGHLGPYMPVVEFYSGPGSPLWAAKGFLGLLNAPDSPFWTDVELPMEVEKKSYLVAMPEVGLTYTGDKETGHVQVYNQMSRSFLDKKYSNFVVSSHFGFDIDRRVYTYNYDNCFAVSTTGEHFVIRKVFTHVATAPGFSASWWNPIRDENFQPLKEVQIDSNLVIKDDFHVRLTRLVTNQPLWVFDGGHALGYNSGKPRIRSGWGWEYASVKGRCVFIRSLYGFEDQVKAEGLLGARRGNNIYHRFSVVPAMKHRVRGAGQYLFASLVVARLKEEPPARLARLVAGFELRPPGAVVRFADGEAVFCQFTPLQDVSLELNGVPLSGKIRYVRIDPAGKVVSEVRE